MYPAAVSKEKARTESTVGTVQDLAQHGGTDNLVVACVAHLASVCFQLGGSMNTEVVF